MAYIVGKDDKKKQEGMNVLGQPGSFANIKSQLQGEQLQQAIQPQHAAPEQSEDEKRKKRGYAHGGVVQHFEDGGRVQYFADKILVEGVDDDDEEFSVTGQSRTGGGATTGRGIGATAPQQRSGSFTGIQDYITANKPKIEQVSEEISSGIEREAGDIRSATDTAQTDYDERQSGSEDFITEQVEGAGSGFDTDYSGETPEARAIREEQDTANTRRYDDLRTGADQGTNLQSQGYDASRLEGRAGRLGSAEGRYAELQRIVGKQPGYSRGERRLDQLALGGESESRIDTIRRAREATQGLGSHVSDTARNIGAQRTVLMNQARDKAEEARSFERDARQQREDRLAGLDVGGGISDEDLAALGLNRDQVQNLYNVDPSKYIRSGGITQKRLARMNALAKLRGQEGSYSDENLYASPDEFLSAVGSAKSAYEQEYGADARAAGDRAIDARFTGDYGRFQKDIDKNVARHKKKSDMYWREGQRGNDPYFKARADAQRAAREKYKFGQGLGE